MHDPSLQVFYTKCFCLHKMFLSKISDVRLSQPQAGAWAVIWAGWLQIGHHYPCQLDISVQICIPAFPFITKCTGSKSNYCVCGLFNNSKKLETHTDHLLPFLTLRSYLVHIVHVCACIYLGPCPCSISLHACAIQWKSRLRWGCLSAQSSLCLIFQHFHQLPAKRGMYRK